MKRVALITGSGRGIGRSTALELAERGISVVINDMDSTGAEETAALARGKGAQALVSVANVAKREGVQRLFTDIRNEFGRLDILVNNAGITRDSIMDKMTEEQWDMVMTVNLKGVFLCTQEAARIMAENSYGRIVNLSSVTGMMGNIGQLNYAASKGGVIAMTKTLAKELARAGITVNAVAPGFIKTPMTETVPEKVMNKLLATIPLARQGEAEEVAKVIAFLASDDASYVTGQILGVNGGMYV